MKKILIDTNVLIYSIDKNSVYHRKAYNIVNNNNLDLYTTSKNISEFLVVTSREIPFSLNLNEILDTIDFFISRFSLLFPNDQTFGIFRMLISKYKPKGNIIHDYEIASIALGNDVDIIATFNMRDFIEI